MFTKLNLPTKPTYLKLDTDIDFFQLFKVVESEFNTCFFLESLYKEEFNSRHSLLGFEPEMLISASGNNLKFEGESDILQQVYPEFDKSINQSELRILNLEVANPYYSLREIIPQNILSKSNFCGGLIGYISYEAINYFEPSLHLTEHPDFNQFSFGLYLDGLLYDKMTGEISYFYYKNNRFEKILKLINKTKSQERLNKSTSIVSLGNSLTQAEHENAVNKVIEEIKSGNSFQCEVGFKTKFTVEGDKLNIYQKLREINPSPFMYYLKFAENILIGASPELLFRLKDGEMETYPLAGTIKRGLDEIEDRQLAKTLLNDPKEKAEHNMLVDLHRNDIGRVAKFGTVKIRKLMDIKKFSYVQHISSEIAGILDDEKYDMFDGLASNFPAGTLSGAPKIESIKILQTNEQEPRGPYGGAVGYFGFNGGCMFCIPIRSLFIHKNEAFAQTSGGIVFDSKPENEYQEIVRKLEAMKQVMEHFNTY